MPFTLATPIETTEEIKKSRFLCRAFPITSIENAEAIINSIRAEMATHHCFAWKYGQNYKFSDDGEPTGTAGKPILSAIEGRNCDRVLVIVTRWFGGVKLGTGGLVRAYGGSASRALQEAQLVELIEWKTINFHCPFHLIPIVQNELKNFQSSIENQIFDDKGCLFSLTLPAAQVDNFVSWLTDKSSGKIAIHTDDENDIPTE